MADESAPAPQTAAPDGGQAASVSGSRWEPPSPESLQALLPQYEVVKMLGRGGMGTLHFMAPEMMLGSEHVDHRADLYAVGVMLYQMLTGKLPFLCIGSRASP